MRELSSKILVSERHYWTEALLILLAAASFASINLAATSQPQARTGTIHGRVRLNGKSPGNVVIRMGVDPMCSKINAGKRVVQAAIVTSADGGLANVFVKLEGNFPAAPIPADPVVIDQRGCIYEPRVVGARAGQTLQIRNSDPLSHNVHSVSAYNSFNVGQASAGVVNSFRLKDESAIVQLKCDVHRWMTAYIGIVNHPYFAVSSDGGVFEIRNVPVGTHRLQSWHETFGSLSQTVTVKAGATVSVDLAYTPK